MADSLSALFQERSSSESGRRTYELHSLDRAFSTLEILSESSTPLSLAEICNKTGLHKSTAHRALMVLERWGVIERTRENRFRLGLKLYELGSRAVGQSDLRSRTHPFFERLSTDLGETVHLGVLQDTSIVYLDKIDPSHRYRMACRIGIANPAYCTSMGKAILAFQPPHQAEQSIAKMRFVPHTQKTLRSSQAFLRSLERVRQRGYAIDDEEIEAGVRCIGAPIFGDHHVPVAAVSVSGPSSRITQQSLPEIARRLLRCCTEVSTLLSLKPAAARSTAYPRPRLDQA